MRTPGIPLPWNTSDTPAPPLFRPGMHPERAGFGDAELLAFVLRGHVPDLDLADIARRLLDRFGSFSRVITAPAQALAERGELPPDATHALATMHEAAIRLSHAELVDNTKLDDIDKLLAFVHARHGKSPIECVHAFFLDAAGHLLHDEVVATGTVDHAPVYPREILRRAIDCNAVGMIVVHNHPSGDPTPSHADHRSTRELARAADAIGVTLVDHVIVAANGHTSFRRSGWL